MECSFSTLFFMLHTAFWRAPSRARAREIVESTLPEAWQSAFAARQRQTQLRRGRSLFAAQAARDALFQNLNHGGGRSLDRFADQQVNVFRHVRVTHERKTVAVADFAQHLDKDILGANRTQERLALITTEGNEVKMPAPVDASEFVGHRGEETPKPRPFEKREGSATRKSETSHPALTYWSGLIKSRALVNRKNRKGWAQSVRRPP